jgi:hypothetical protein
LSTAEIKAHERSPILLSERTLAAVKTGEGEKTGAAGSRCCGKAEDGSGYLGETGKDHQENL